MLRPPVGPKGDFLKIALSFANSVLSSLFVRRC